MFLILKGSMLSAVTHYPDWGWGEADEER